MVGTLGFCASVFASALSLQCPRVQFLGVLDNMGKQSRRCRQVSAGYVMRVVELVGRDDGGLDDGGLDAVGKFVHSIPDIDHPCTWKFTAHLTKAKRFDNLVQAFDLHRMQSLRAPLRADGKPNRPLTAYSVNVMWAES